MADARKAEKADQYRVAIKVRERHQFFLAVLWPLTFVSLVTSVAVMCRSWVSEHFWLVLLLASLLFMQSALTLLLHRSWQSLDT